mmetsp:Transcript_7281/g.17758  ORF Transcript_7281/g.17758 Transcript_7281/m.17758 type:complete len:286 (+) Transcript_7281:177-1034(+)
MRRQPRRICLFGTSANPPTGNGGHAGIVRALVRLRKFDEIWILPVYQHTFAAKRNQLLGFDHRVAMCELAVQELEQEATGGDSTPDPTPHNGCPSWKTKIIVSRAEEDSFQRLLESSQAKTDEEKASLRVGTADLLEMLLENKDGQQLQQTGNDANDAGPQLKFSFCLGSDTFLDLTDWKWKRSRDVLKLLEGRLVIVHRKSTSITSRNDVVRERIDKLNSTDIGNGKIVLLDIPNLGDVSSSNVRNATNKDRVNYMLSPKVLDYVIANNLYGFGVDPEDSNVIG